MGFYHDRTRVRLWSRAFVRADESGEIILYRDHGTLDEARAAHCLVRDASHYLLFHGAAYDWHLVQCTNAADEHNEMALRAEEQRQREATQAPALAAKESAPGMEFFPDRTGVRLGILAEEDGEAIACRRNRGTTRPRHGAWAVHRLVRDDADTDYVLFHSASYGQYLAYDSPEQNDVLFQADGAEDGSDDIHIRHFTFGVWCRPDDQDAALPGPWPLHWVVEAIPPRQFPPELPHPILANPPPAVPFAFGGPICLRRRGIHAVQPQAVLQRRINYVQADGQVNFYQLQWAGSNGRLNPLVVLATESPDFTLSVWATSQGRLTPVMDPSDDQPMDMVLSQKSDGIYIIPPNRLHGLPSRITADQIGSMQVFLMCVGVQYFLDVFNNCLEPIVGQAQQQNSFREFLGNPMQQTVPSTCAIVSAAKCVEMQHRREYETHHGVGTFPCEAASPRKLRRLCRSKKLWTQRGAYVGDVLEEIKLVGGIKTTNAPPPAPYQLPLRSWQQHTSDDLTSERVMELLDSRGPFVGTFWVCPWFSLFDAKTDDDLVYRSGCARNVLMQDWSERCFQEYKVPLGLHSVVCFAYRVVAGDLHVLVLDNNSATGPERWIHYLELQEVHTVRVKRLDPPVHLDGRALVYPKSIYI